MSKQWPDKTIIGLTGNIATGKSAIMRMAAEKGALTLDADKIVHEILENDPGMQAAIAVAFGPDVRQADGRIDRAALASIVFTDEDALRDLELMLHPAVRQEIGRRIDESEKQTVILEAIKLLEGELVEIIDQVWVTRCPQKVQIERLMVCRGMDAETAALRVDAQGAQEAKVARADVVIETDGTMADTKAQFELAWEQLPESGAQADGQEQMGATDPEEIVPLAETEAEAKEQEAVQEEDAVETGATASAVADAEAAEAEEVVVRRARPSDIPGILLVIHRATGGETKLKRADLLHSFSERSYLIGQVGTEISTVIGWNTDSTTAVCMDRFYFHPLEAAQRTFPPVLAEVEKSAAQLICEVALAFLPDDLPEAAHEILRDAGYEKMEPDDLPEAAHEILRDAGYEKMEPDKMPRAWQATVREMRPAGTAIMGKVLRDIRVS